MGSVSTCLLSCIPRYLSSTWEKPIHKLLGRYSCLFPAAAPLFPEVAIETIDAAPELPSSRNPEGKCKVSADSPPPLSRTTFPAIRTRRPAKSARISVRNRRIQNARYLAIARTPEPRHGASLDIAPVRTMAYSWDLCCVLVYQLLGLTNRHGSAISSLKKQRTILPESHYLLRVGGDIGTMRSGNLRVNPGCRRNHVGYRVRNVVWQAKRSLDQLMHLHSILGRTLTEYVR